MTIALIVIFVIGYAAIAFEHNLKINKTAPALLTGVILWAVYILTSPDKTQVNAELLIHLGDISSILFFLMGAMTIVEVIDSYNGFEVITKRINQTDKVPLLWVIALLSFFLSAILDNLTTTIVMVSLLRKLIKDHETRLFYVGIVVVAANSGGAWSPIGDVTTTMLWIGGQISASNTIVRIFLPSLVSLLVPLGILSLTMKGKVERPMYVEEGPRMLSDKQQLFILTIGILMLINVPIFKTITTLPPFTGMLLGLGVIWVVIEIMHQRYKRQTNSDKPLGRTMMQVLSRIDLASILFFMGILLAVSALQAAGILTSLAMYLDNTIGNLSAIVMSIGLLSAIVDNVPLVAASMGMYDLAQYPMDHYLWEFLAYCAGTGGSILIIGSAAGVAAMGMERIDFFWYVKKISWLALIGYFAGALFYIAEHTLFHSF